MQSRKDFIFNFLKTVFRVKLSHKKHTKEQQKLVCEWHDPCKPIEKSSEPVITWIGQSTFLIQIDDVNIVTDPIFFHLNPVLLRRFAPPGISIENLPKIDFVIISHDHRDHFEKKSLIKLAQHDPIALAPHGLGKRLEKRGFKKIVEHHHGDKHSLITKSNKKLTFTFLPAAHWAGSNIFNIHKSKYGSWMIENENHNIYFAGDSSYDGHFKEIAQEFKSIHTALMPIGPVEPRDLIDHAHLDGKQAIAAFIDLCAQNFIPMHWGTFQFGLEQFDEPVKILKSWWEQEKEKLSNKKLLVLKFGKRQKLNY